jgi:hypothetical protein
MGIRFALSVLLILVYSLSLAAENPTYNSNYLGQDKRQIKSLSKDDIEQLENGKGWGLAKAAELNGMPGPSHVLQMKAKISLSSKQQIQIQSLFDDMQAKAIPLGKKLIKLEKALNDAFANQEITTASLKQMLNAISKVHTELRYIHLVTHLKTPRILSSQQIEKYNRLRGYNSGDPCESIPEGHDTDMWKKHNGCQ